MPRITDRPNYAVPWSAKDLAIMTAQIKAGRTIPEVAKAMGRSQEAVRNRAWKAGLLPTRKRNSVDAK